MLRKFKIEVEGETTEEAVYALGRYEDALLRTKTADAERNGEPVTSLDQLGRKVDRDSVKCVRGVYRARRDVRFS